MAPSLKLVSELLWTSEISLYGQTAHWFASYLSSRSQCIESAEFSFLPLLKGVLQSSILGPLLFPVNYRSSPALSIP